MTWCLIDYGVGNIHSLAKALVAAGADIEIVLASASDAPDKVAAADVAVLPGVGAFGAVMSALRPLHATLVERHASARPIVGICIGMQVLYEGSTEAPEVPGLGIVSGQVEALDPAVGKVPHMGWNTLESTTDSLFAELGHVYYVHSYAAGPNGAAATTLFGTPFAAAIHAGNTIGFQFHPEKSSKAGAALLKRVVDLLSPAETP